MCAMIYSYMQYDVILTSHGFLLLKWLLVGGEGGYLNLYALAIITHFDKDGPSISLCDCISDGNVGT